MRLSELASEYGMTLPEIKEFLRSRIIFLAPADPIIDGTRERRIRNIIQTEIEPPVPPAPAQPRPAQPKPVPPKPVPPKPVPPRPVQPKPVPPKPVPPRPAPPAYNADSDDLLKRDYVILTNAALRKPQTVDILFKIVENQSNGSQTKIVVCTGAIEHMGEAARRNADLHGRMAECLRILQNNGLLTELESTAAAEHHAISGFLRSTVTPYDKSILIVGYNRALSAYVEFRNRQAPEGASRVITRDVRAIRVNNERKGCLALLTNTPNFSPSDGKPDASFSMEARDIGAIPEENDTVYLREADGMRPITLERRINQGAEGAIYKVTIDGKVKCAKLFFRDSNTEMKFKKIRLMCERAFRMRGMDPLTMDYLAWPEHIVYTADGRELGYTMNFFDGTVPLSRLDHNSMPTLILGCDRRHQVTLAVNLSALIEFLHANNVILCDINRGNVLIDPTRLQVYLVDLDSAQIADDNVCYPTNVAWPEYLSPEHIMDEDYAFRHTKADDIWILQMLLFRLLTPAFSTPYLSSQPVEDDRYYIRDGMYPFQWRDHRAESGLGGTPYHKVISSFPSYIKECFWQSFHRDGESFNEGNRRDAHYWLCNMVRYQNDLPHLIEENPEYGRLWPEYIQRPNDPNRPEVARSADDIRASIRQIDDVCARLEALVRRRPQPSHQAGTPNNTLIDFTDPIRNESWQA